jgi:hypothetical protein
VERLNHFCRYEDPVQLQHKTLVNILNDPVPSAIRNSIAIAADLYQRYDPVICDPTREFSILFLNGKIVGGTKDCLSLPQENQLKAKYGLLDGVVWEEMVSEHVCQYQMLLTYLT